MAQLLELYNGNEWIIYTEFDAVLDFSFRVLVPESKMIQAERAKFTNVSVPTLVFVEPVDTSIECDPVCHYISATSHFYHVSGELHFSVVHGRVWCLCVQSLRNWQHIVGGCGSAPAPSSASDGGLLPPSLAEEAFKNAFTAHDTQTTRQRVECKSNVRDDRQGHTLISGICRWNDYRE